MVPVLAPLGTVTLSEVVEAVLTDAVVPLNLTVLLAAKGSKLVPVIVTLDPTSPLEGVKDVIVGVWSTSPETTRVAAWN
jgi:hypothetical protein